jgi:transposase InsO family protein
LGVALSHFVGEFKRDLAAAFAQRGYSFVHPFDRTCRNNGIEHRLTKPRHPWTNGQVE